MEDMISFLWDNGYLNIKTMLVKYLHFIRVTEDGRTTKTQTMEGDSSMKYKYEMKQQDKVNRKLGN